MAATDLRLSPRARTARISIRGFPSVSGRQASVHEAGISVRGRISGNEEEFTTDELLDQIVTWPGRTPETEDED